MPYETIQDLPPEVRNSYDDNPKQLRAFLAAFNSALATNPDDESSAFAVAHSAAQGVKSIPLDFYLESGFKALPDNRFIAWYTNPYQDKDNEWFAEKAIDEDIALMQKSATYPELWFYHVEGTKFGNCETVFKAGRFAVALGKFDNTPQAQAFKDFAIENDFKLSHGFSYDPAQFTGNTYHKFHTFEISVLPQDSAANPFTFFAMPNDIGGNKTMDISPQQKAVIEQALKGTGLTYEHIVQTSQKATSALDGKVSYKATPEEIIAQDVGTPEPPEVEIEAPMDDMGQLKAMLAKLSEKMDALSGIKELLDKAFAPKEEPQKAAISPNPADMASEQEKEMMKALKSLSQKVVDLEAQLSNKQQAFNLYEAVNDFGNFGQKNNAAVPGQFDAAWFTKQAIGGGE